MIGMNFSRRVLASVLAVALGLGAPLAARAGNALLIGIKGNHRDWTSLQGEHPRGLGATPYLRQVYEVVTEPAFHGYLLDQIQRTPGDVTITLVDDSVPGAHSVWPHAEGREFLISESWFTKYPKARGPQKIRGLLAHELSHTQDRAGAPEGSYGLDSSHFRTEVITQRAAMIEGWADYQAISFSPWGEASYRWADLDERTTQEDHEEKGKYHHRSLRTFADWMRVEIAVARVLHTLAVHTPQGRAAISEAFDATNDGKVRTLPRLLTELARRHPDLAGRYAALTDSATEFSATAAELRDIFGPGGATYVKELRRLSRP